ncbi:MAG: exodeoxyribonuclease VII large subunit [Fimbriiglobus sp.]
MTPLPKPMTVTSLTTSIRLRMEEHYPGVSVLGEVSNFTRAASGHCYFKLKDAGAIISCVMFRGFALRLHFEPRDGMQVVARGGVTVYPQRGEYQIQVEELHLQGVGAAELALRQLKEKLSRKGYFLPERKRALPKYPRRIALVASPTGAAIRDMLEIARHRWPVLQVLVRPSKVQGEGAANELSGAIHTLNQLHISRKMPLDAIVLGRGGGSYEDLSAFNEEIVADAIFHSVIPVISAVGHEIDVSIADMVADFRALTPSQAMTALCPDHTELRQVLAYTQTRLNDALQGRVGMARERLDRIADRPVFRKPLSRIRDAEQDVDDLAARLIRAIQHKLETARQTTTALADQLESLSPLQVLRRGYTLTTQAGAVVRRASDVKPGDELLTRTADGEIVSQVLSISREKP